MKQLIKPRFIGRLGNNLFQLAAAIGCAKKHGVGWGIKKGYVERGFNAKQIDKFLPHLPVCDQYFKAYTEFQDKWAGLEFNYHEIPFHPNGCELVGFWQSEKYFDNAKEEVGRWINLPFIEGYRDYVSIHIRRGDYVNLDTNFPPVNFHYIMKAMEVFGAHTKYLVFSDDINWCKETIKASRFEGCTVNFVEGGSEWGDLSLMASCGHNIIANSSFSWWAAWLNTNPNKIVVTPSAKWGNWFGPDNGVKHDCPDLIPEGWKQIEFRTIDKEAYKENPEKEKQKWIDMNRVWSNPNIQTLVKIMK